MLFVLLIAILASCGPDQGEVPITMTPVYTPIVMSAESTKLPVTALLVSIEDLAVHPEQYVDQFIEVRGLNARVYARPACWPRYDPPSEWLLVSGPTVYQDNVAVNRPASIEVKNTFGNMDSDPSDLSGWAIHQTMMKRASVWGWWRAYQGPIGCGSVDQQGTPVPPPDQRMWYLDAVKLQYLESIEVPTPAKQ